MIKISKDTKDIKDIKLGNKQVVKVCRGIDVEWEKEEEKEKLVYSDTGRSRYDISINSWSNLNPNKNYKFVTNLDSEYVIISNGSYTTIKNNDVFKITKNCDIQIKNIYYGYYDIKIYKVKEEATLII